MDDFLNKKRVKHVNIIFLITICANLAAGFMPEAILPKSAAGLLIFSQLFLISPMVIYLLVARIPVREAVRIRKLNPKAIGWIILFGITVMPLLTFLNALSQTFASNSIAGTITDISGSISFLPALLVVAILPACFEEFVYRGVFFESYSRVNPLWGAVLSGLLFGIMHGNFNQFIYAFVLGVIFALLVEATDSIFSSMIVHFMINGSSTVMLYAIPKIYEFAKKEYEAAVIAGDTNITEMLYAYFGDMSFENGKEWYASMAAETGYLTLGSVVSQYFIPAVLGCFLAFLVFKKILKVCDRTELFLSKFRVNSKLSNLISIPLVAAIIIGIGIMILVELASIQK